MRFNEKELRLFGMSNQGKTDYEGFLFKRGERARDAFKKRYFVLRGNLLFYFPSHQQGIDPSGCIVLERASVISDTSDDHIQRFKFRIEFDSPDARVYHLYATSPACRETWIDRIRKASFELLRKAVMQLREQLVALTGEDVPKALRQYLEPDIAQVTESKNVLRKSMRVSRFFSRPSLSTFKGSSSSPTSSSSAPKSSSQATSVATTSATTTATTTPNAPADTNEDFNTVEIFIDAQNLSLVEDETLPERKRAKHKIHPTVFLTVHTRVGDIWIPAGRTETEQSCSPKFSKPVCVPRDDLKKDSLLRFTIYHIPKKNAAPQARHSLIADASLDEAVANARVARKKQALRSSVSSSERSSARPSLSVDGAVTAASSVVGSRSTSASSNNNGAAKDVVASIRRKNKHYQALANESSTDAVADGLVVDQSAVYDELDEDTLVSQILGTVDSDDDDDGDVSRGADMSQRRAGSTSKSTTRYRALNNNSNNSSSSSSSHGNSDDDDEARGVKASVHERSSEPHANGTFASFSRNASSTAIVDPLGDEAHSATASDAQQVVADADTDLVIVEKEDVPDAFEDEDEDEDDDDYEEYEDQNDVIANLTLDDNENDMELSETNPFHPSHNNAEEMLAVKLGVCEVTSAQVLAALDVPVVTLECMMADKASPAAILRLRCDSTTQSFIQLPNIEYAPEVDDADDADVVVDKAFPARPAAASIFPSKQCHYDINPDLLGRQSVRVREVMKSSPYFLTIPIQLLKLYIAEDNQEWKELNAIDVVGSLQKVKREKSNRAMERKALYSNEWATLDGFSDQEPFKKSTLKKKQMVEMVPTNLHIQTLNVKTHDHHVHLYDVITLGCPAAHAIGFKKGGLAALSREDKDQRRRLLSSRIMKPEDYKECKLVLERIDAQFVKEQERISKSKFGSTQYTKSIESIKRISSDLDEFFSRPALQQAITLVANHKPPSLDSLQGSDFQQAYHEAFVQFCESVDANQPKKAAKRFELCIQFFGKWIVDIEYTLAIINLLNSERREPMPDLTHRQDVVFSQALTTLVTAFLTSFHRRYHEQRFLCQLRDAGYLFQVSSYLSTFRHEEDMIDDSVRGFGLLKTVKFKFSVVEEKLIDPKITGSRKRIIVDVGITRKMMSKLPEELQNGKHISVYPVFFTMGVNETQTYANKFGDNTLQVVINEKSERALTVYAERYLGFVKGCYPAEYAREREAINVMVDALRKTMKKKKGKNIGVLHRAEDLCRAMSGGRATMCKSGKDRTGMAVTLEMVQILCQEHNMNPNRKQLVLNELRAKGTRRTNVMLNTGSNLYAFNSFQRKTLPSILQPPENACGMNIS